MPYKVSLAPETEKLLEEKIPLKAARERIEYWRTHRSYGSDPQGYMRYCPDNPRAFNYPTVQAINVYEVPNGLLLVDGKYEKLSECTFAHEKNAVFVDKGDSEVFVNRGAHIGRGDFSRMVEAPACRM
jgi:hypothetical protein